MQSTEIKDPSSGCFKKTVYMEIQIQITSQMESEYVEREREFNSKTRLHCKPKESMWNRYHIHKVREWRIKETPSLTLYCRNGGILTFSLHHQKTSVMREIRLITAKTSHWSTTARKVQLLQDKPTKDRKRETSQSDQSSPKASLKARSSEFRSRDHFNLL